MEHNDIDHRLLQLQAAGVMDAAILADALRTRVSELEQLREISPNSVEAPALGRTLRLLVEDVVGKLAGEEWLSTTEAAELGDVTDDLVRRWAREGRVRSRHSGTGRWLVEKRDFLGELQVGG